MGKGRTWRKRRQKSELSDPKRKDLLFCQEEYIRLRKWMKSKGNFQCPHLVPHVFAETGRGLMTLKSLKPGDLLLSISDKLIITTATVLSSEIGQSIQKCDPPLTAHEALAIFLLNEQSKGVNSYWYPYVSLLPQSFDMPAFWSPSTLNKLPPVSLERAGSSLQTLHAAHRRIFEWCTFFCPHLKPLLSTPNQFFWAWFAVNSRCVYMEVPHSDFIKDQQKNYALLPFMDLLNHSPKAQISVKFNDLNRSFEIVTLDHFPKYEQVFIKYGCHSNTELLMEYGFTIPENPYNFYEFSFDEILFLAIKMNVTYPEQKEKIIQTDEFDSGLFCFDDEHFFSWKLLVVIHILFLSSWTELKNWQSSVSTMRIFSCLQKERKNLALNLFKNSIEKLEKQKNVCDKSSSIHERLCSSLWEDDLHILRKAQQNLIKL